MSPVLASSCLIERGTHSEEAMSYALEVWVIEKHLMERRDHLPVLSLENVTLRSSVWRARRLETRVIKALMGDGKFRLPQNGYYRKQFPNSTNILLLVIRLDCHRICPLIF